MTNFPTAGRSAWLFSVLMAASTMACAVWLTHVFWHFLRFTPFLLAFGAAVLSAAVAGRAAGVIAVAFGVLGYGWFPPSLPQEGMTRLLGGFALVSGSFSWIVATQRQVEAALRAGETRLREAQELAHVGNWQWDVLTSRLWWSDELYRIFGVARGANDLTYGAFLDLIHPDDLPSVERAGRAAVQEKRPTRLNIASSALTARCVSSMDMAAASSTNAAASSVWSGRRKTSRTARSPSRSCSPASAACGRSSTRSPRA